MNVKWKLMARLVAVLALGMAGSTLAAEELVWWKFDQNSGTTAFDASGSVRVEIQDANGVLIKGYTLADSPERYGDEIEGVMRWKNGPDVGALAGKSVQLRFVLKDADIYSMRFTK